MTSSLHGLQQVVIDTAAGPLPLDETRNAVRDRAAVIVVHEALGVNDHLRDVLVRFGAAGFHAVAPHLYHRHHEGAITYGDYDTIFAQLGAMRDSEVIDDIDATVDHLSAQGWSPEQIAVVGFNVGARVTFLVARERSLGSAVGFYGGGIVTPPERLCEALPSLIEPSGVTPVRTPWLGIYGEADHSMPDGDVGTLEMALTGQPARIALYPEAGHSFHSDARPDFYSAPAARAAWADAMEWLDEHLALRP